MYYDGTKLLSTKDIDGLTPEIFATTTNRTGGKTTYFNRLCLNRYKKGKGKFALLYRFTYDLDGCSEKFFKDIGSLFFPDSKMKEKEKIKNTAMELFLDGESCGYAIPLNKAEKIKEMSHLFSDTGCCFMDEFQSETNTYCPNEITKFQSIHTSLARGQGQQVKYLPVFMAANPVTILNPYYIEWGFSTRLDAKTKYLRGHGVVLEQGYVESADKAQQASGFNRAFSGSQYNAYAAQGVYLNDNLSFIEKPTGHSRYLATIKYENSEYGIREYADEGIVYCTDKADSTFPVKIAVTTNDHAINYVMLKRNDIFISNLRWYFDHGCFRFKDLKCKEALLKTISY